MSLSVQVENSSQESPQNSSKWPSWKFLTVITSKFLYYQVEIPLCVINQISLSLTNQMFLWVIKLRVPHSGHLKVPPKNQGENSSQWPSKNLAENVSQLPHQNSLQRQGWIFLSLLTSQWPSWKFHLVTKLKIHLSDKLKMPLRDSVTIKRIPLKFLLIYPMQVSCISYLKALKIALHIFGTEPVMMQSPMPKLISCQLVNKQLT